MKLILFSLSLLIQLYNEDLIDLFDCNRDAVRLPQTSYSTGAAYELSSLLLPSTS